MDAGLVSMKNNERKHLHRCRIACALMLILLGLLLIIQVAFVPDTLTNFLHSEVTERLVMTSDKSNPDSKFYEYFKMWSDQRSDGAGIGKFYYWVFNVTNPYEAANGIELPKIDKIGPYVFTRYEKKNNITWNVDETIVHYTNTYEFVFDPTDSTHVSMNESIYCVSGQMIVFLSNPLVTLMFPEAITAMETWPAEWIFAFDTIENFLFGYVDEKLEAITGLSDPVYFVNDDPIEIEEYTGHPYENLDRIRELIRYRGNQYQQWGDDIPPFNTPLGIYREWVNGSRESGRQWRPENTITKNDILTIFAPEKFRKVNYTFEKEIEINGLKLYRFRINDNEWWQTTNHDDTGFQVFQQEMEWDGVMRLDWTRNSQTEDSITRAPILLSKGLFKDAPEWQNNVTIPYGIDRPDPGFDDQYIDIEPVSGTAFRVLNTYMISLQVTPLNFSIHQGNVQQSNFTNLPNLWIPQQYTSAEAFAQPDTIDFFVNNMNLIDGLKYASWIGLPILGVLFIIIAIWVYYRKIKVDTATYFEMGDDNVTHDGPTKTKACSTAGVTDGYGNGYGSRDITMK